MISSLVLASRFFLCVVCYDCLLLISFSVVKFNHQFVCNCICRTLKKTHIRVYKQIYYHSQILKFSCIIPTSPSTNPFKNVFNFQTSTNKHLFRIPSLAAQYFQIDGIAIVHLLMPFCAFIVDRLIVFEIDR